MHEHYIKLIIVITYFVIFFYAILSDVQRLIIPNWCSVALIVLFAIYAYFFHSMSDLVGHFLIGGGVLIAGYGLYMLGWFGAGDVKLLSAAMLWAGVDHALKLIIVTVLLGGVFGFAILFIRQFLRRFPNILNSPKFLRVVASWAESGSFPYGIAIGIAALIVSRDFFFP